MFLLDELLRQEAIDRDVYTQLNGLLSESLPKIGDEQDVEMDTESQKTTDDEGDGEAVDMKVDSDEEVDELKKIINSTLEYVNQHDQKELKELLVEIREDTEEEYIDAVLELEGLMEVFIQDEFLENEPILPKLDDIRRSWRIQILLN